LDLEKVLKRTHEKDRLNSIALMYNILLAIALIYCLLIFLLPKRVFLLASKAFRTLNARSINTLQSVLALNPAITFARLFVESQNKNTISMPKVENV
jgi:hypothetical protein